MLASMVVTIYPRPKGVIKFWERGQATVFNLQVGLMLEASIYKAEESFNFTPVM